MVINTLILGLGNDILTDDGIGPRLISDLAVKFQEPYIHFKSTLNGGLQIIEEIRLYDRIIFIDAIQTRNGNPGDIYYFTPYSYRDTLHISSLHDINFLTALRMCEKLDIEIPSDLHVIAVEIVEDKVFGEDFTPPLKEKYPGILQETTAMIKKIISD